MLAWSDPRLKHCCVSAEQLHIVFGASAQVFEDLAYAVAKAPDLEALRELHCITVDAHARGLSISIKEVAMFTRPINADGNVVDVQGQAWADSQSATRSLVVDDIRLRGESLLRRER